MLALYNAHIQSQSSKYPRATALLIHQGRILAMGSDDEILSLIGGDFASQNMEGMTIWPGLTDGHMHLQHYALGLQQVHCETDTLQECLQQVAQRAQITPPEKWIIGWGWNQNVWGGVYGTAQDLDAVAPRHPVHLVAKSGHASWANSVALKLAGITKDIPDPEGGRIQRNSEGKPTGILFESATELVSSHIPRESRTEIKAAVVRAQPDLWEMGLTGVHDFSELTLFSALQELQQEELLQLRVVKGIPLEQMATAIEIGLQSGFGDDYLRTGSVKAFSDGALGPQTAAMLAPYENTAENKGILLLDQEQIFGYGKQATQNGLSLATHAIGDRANREVISGYEKIRAFEDENHLPRRRHRIEHVQLLDPKDQQRLWQLGIIASMQPIHATSDLYIADKYWGKRAAGAYIFRTLLDYGTVLAFGSDAPVETPNPFVGLHAAVTRRRMDGTPGPEGWHPEQRIRLSEALHAYTIGPAYAAGWEQSSGKLEPGYFADLIVLEKDPFSLEPDELFSIKPSATMIGGNWVWQS